MNTAAGPSIRVNDEVRPLAGATALDGLARALGVADRKGIAIAVNGAVVPRAAWPQRMLVDGDRVIVIRATQGG